MKVLIQRGEVQSTSASKTAGRSGGTTAGPRLISGASERKDKRLSHDRSSAKILSLPGKCSALSDTDTLPQEE